MVRLLEIESQLYDGLNYISATIQKNKVRHPYFYHLKGNFLMHHVQFQKAITEFKKANALFICLNLLILIYQNYVEWKLGKLLQKTVI